MPCGSTASLEHRELNECCLQTQACTCLCSAWIDALDSDIYICPYLCVTIENTNGKEYVCT
eukprot:m.138891 g.138891  ORF g.138891 m.138891 type:complete len:61 (-) comp17601_c0_seq1:136-318(-)